MKKDIAFACLFLCISISKAQNVGIGTTNPLTKLHVAGINTAIKLDETNSGTTSLITRYTNRLEIQSPDIFQISMGTFANPSFLIDASSNVGIGTGNPGSRLQVQTADASYGFTHTNGTVTVGSFVGNSGGWFGTQTNHPLYFFTNNGNVQLTILPNGNVGIGAITPANNLQVGSVGSTGYGGNHIAFGNGTNASGITQTNSVAQWYSTTDIALMPRGNGHGRVGINTTSANAPLDVRDFVTFSTGSYALFTLGVGPSAVTVAGNISPQTSIRAESMVVATEFDANSDLRIKNIKGISNGANDLQTLNAIQVTDYTLKDKIKNGDRLFKKVIAQQVETVYPQVISKHTDFIPNVYAAASNITKTEKGWLLLFEGAHHISKNAVWLKVLASAGHVMSKVEIVSIPSDKEVEITADNLSGDKIFVYGEEVSDFRTVDYEGLTTLNISATQELSKLLQLQQEQIKLLQTEVAELKKQNSITSTK